MNNFTIKPDNLQGSQIRALLKRHLDEMSAASPPESVHALDLEGLRAPEITFWSIWEGDQLLGSGALKQLDAEHGEIKSMHVHSDARGKGVADKMLNHILDTARARCYTRLSLETGSMKEFAPARKLYEKYGFTQCPVFGDYQPDVNSICMTKVL